MCLGGTPCPGRWGSQRAAAGLPRCPVHSRFLPGPGCRLGQPAALAQPRLSNLRNGRPREAEAVWHPRGARPAAEGQPRAGLGGKERGLKDSQGQTCVSAALAVFQRKRWMERLLQPPLHAILTVRGLRWKFSRLRPNSPPPSSPRGRAVSGPSASATSMPKLPPAQIDVSRSLSLK